MRAWLDKPAQGEFGEAGEVKAEVTLSEVTLSEVMADGLGLTVAQQTPPVQKRVADALNGLGWLTGHTSGLPGSKESVFGFPFVSDVL